MKYRITFQQVGFSPWRYYVVLVQGQTEYVGRTGYTSYGSAVRAAERTGATPTGD